MGLFAKLISKFTGSTPTSAPIRAVSTHAIGIEVKITGTSGATPEVSDFEVAERMREHDFVPKNDPPPLTTADQWWNEETHKRRRREGSDKAYAWLVPFVSIEIAKREELQEAQKWGPHGAGTIAKELRALIREHRKSKVPHRELLSALYGACVAVDLSESLKFEGSQPHYMARFVDIKDVSRVEVNYTIMGYQCIDALTKTDVKWLIEAFGEPSDHQSFEALWPHIRQNAVARYCWGELRSKNESAKSLGWPQQSIQEWLEELVKRNLGYHKEWQERVEVRKASLAELVHSLDAAWEATRQPFVVADIETTGLNAGQNEILELAAVLVESTGRVTDQFSVLVRPSASVPAEITRLTGITQAEVDAEGRLVSDALNAFIAFVGDRPIFFHNAPFDLAFIKKARSFSTDKFANPVHDTLPLARQAWPTLGTYNLAALARQVGASPPEHRALSDANAALAVLLAARTKLQRE